MLLVGAISFLAISSSPATSLLVIFTSWPRTEVANLPSVKIDSCGHLLTRYSITLPVSSHPRETKVLTFHVTLLDRERLQVDVAWPWYGNKRLPWDLRQRHCVLNLRHLLGFLLLMILASLTHKDNTQKILDVQAYFKYFPSLSNNPWLAQVLHNPFTCWSVTLLVSSWSLSMWLFTSEQPALFWSF